MKKIPTLFKRDWGGNPSRVTREVNPGCEWVIAGEGEATRKMDGACCMIRGGRLYKRRELRNGKEPPPQFEPADIDEETGKTIGWVPVGDGPDDRYHRAAFAVDPGLVDGTYELIGPKVQGNPERFPSHRLIIHGGVAEKDVPRDFDGLSAWFAGHDVEGIVWHHPDGRMAKIKGRDFGVRRSRTREKPATQAGEAEMAGWRPARYGSIPPQTDSEEEASHEPAPNPSPSEGEETHRPASAASRSR